MNSKESPTSARLRAHILRATRQWFDRRGYLETQTPTMVPSPAMEANLFSFPVGGSFLRTSPEFALKKTLALQMGRIYEIGPCFRAKESGPWHRQEFTMLEWYRVGASIWDLMDEVESLIAHLCGALEAPVPPSWTRISVRALFKDYLNIDLADASATDLSTRDPTWDDAFFRRWVDDIEPRLVTPTFVHSWPASQAALAEVRHDGPWPTAQRFEAFLGGIELANAFQELIDPVEQRRRFLSENAIRTRQGHTPHPIDDELCNAVGQMPRTAGIALGFDRLVAVLCGWDGLR